MKYLLDTNICIYLIKKQPVSVLDRFREHAVGEIGLSVISVAELSYGVQRSRRREQNEQALLQFLAPLVVADFDADAALVYGRVRADLDARGTPIGALDALIAAHAMALDAIVVTNDEREFLSVPRLKVENWVSQ